MLYLIVEFQRRYGVVFAAFSDMRAARRAYYSLASKLSKHDAIARERDTPCAVAGAGLDGLLAQSMGVHGTRVTTAEELIKAMEYAKHNPGPHLIETVVPESLNGVKRKVLPWLLKSLPSLPRPLTKALKKKIAP